MSFTSWIDQQIHEAMERGAFDDLPGAGKPLPSRIDGDDDGQAWLRDYLRREGVSADVLLPAPLKLRKQISRLAEAAPGLESEQDVRDAVAELNHQIRQWRLIPLGPPIFVPLVDEDAMLSRWRESHPQQQPSPSPAGHGRQGRGRARPAAAMASSQAPRHALTQTDPDACRPPARDRICARIIAMDGGPEWTSIRLYSQARW